MSLTKASAEAKFKAARTLLSGSNVTVRHEGREYVGVMGSLEYSDQPGSMVGLQGAQGAVRLLVSELKKPYPESGNIIDVKEAGGTEWEERRVLTPRYDQVHATVRIDYGERDG